MKYTETAAKSAELLRLVLPRIAKHGGNYSPTSYRVWYEYFAGLNQSLARAVDTELASKPAISQPVIDRFYLEHIQSREVRQGDQLQSAMVALMGKLTAAVTASSKGTSDFSQALEKGVRELESVTGASELRPLLESLVHATTTARTSTESLRSELTQTQAEMQSLRQQLGTLEGVAKQDPLTGLLNRRGFDVAIAQLQADDSDGLTKASLLVLDIDFFKRVNDTYGHLFGDQVLTAAGKIILNAVKGRDVAARLGGEEFVVLLPNTPSKGAATLAEQIREAFSRARIRRQGSDKVLDQVTISIGVVSRSADESIEQAMDRADKALYRAKNTGRNRVCVAD